ILDLDVRLQRQLNGFNLEHVVVAAVFHGSPHQLQKRRGVQFSRARSLARFPRRLKLAVMCLLGDGAN
ncbi:hypothetical protein ACEZHJ_02350, partial [Arhodomonas sp. KWT2]|uniref:hypothetical protein n=1 Tax=Arhodomonas sp. KWT2 TaxID=3344194 RepID=UPI0035BFCEF6